MRAMLLERLGPVTEGSAPLRRAELPDPVPGPHEILLRVRTCGVCHTELDEIEGRTPPPRLPVVPGHQVVGVVENTGPDVSQFRPGDRAGVAWIFHACGRCRACAAGNENLCSAFRATGRDTNGGYAELMTVHESFAYPIPPSITDALAAPLLCAGAIGYRSARLAGVERRSTLGLMGFGASAHLVLRMVRRLHPAVSVYVFSRAPAERAFALELGAAWAGAIDDTPPEPLECIIDTTPAWRPVLAGLRCLAPGGRLVINAIRKETGDSAELLRLDYPAHLWEEKEIKSVANVTRRDVHEFLAVAAEGGIAPDVREYPLEEANAALADLRHGHQRGARILRISGE